MQNAVKNLEIILDGQLFLISSVIGPNSVITIHDAQGGMVEVTQSELLELIKLLNETAKYTTSKAA